MLVSLNLGINLHYVTVGARGVGVGDRGSGVHGVNVAVDWNH